MPFAYLHWKGWEWEQFRRLLCTLPGTLSIHPEPEIQGKGFVRDRLLVDALWYLCLRLQLGPSETLAMLRTHSRLSSYPVDQLRRNLDVLETIANPQKLVLRMPSLLGMSVDGLQSRVSFWKDEVGLTIDDLKKLVEYSPSMLQYSLEDNLLPKLTFFRDVLLIELRDLRGITARQPSVWGRSLERHITPWVNSMMASFDFPTEADVGRILVLAPELLLCKWEGNLDAKVTFLRSRLELSREEMRVMVCKTPRVLGQSLSTSLSPKIDLMESKLSSSTRSTLLENPSLLLSSEADLDQRLDWASRQESPSVALMDGRKRKKPVQLIAGDGRVELTFADVHAAAAYAEISVSRMYVVIRQKKLHKGRMFAYVVNERKKSTIKAPASRRETVKTIPPPKEQVPEAKTTLSLHISGRAFPPESDIRGIRRSGGMAFHIDDWSRDDWRRIVNSIWRGRKLRLLPGEKTMVIGYPYTRPSRPRCTLYAVREALRLVQEWLSHDAGTKTEAKIEILVDSFVVDYLQDTDALYTWGSVDKMEDFEFTGEGPRYRANPDILYPLARSYYNLVSRSSSNVTITFRRADSRETAAGAMLAAKLMHETTV